MRIENCLSAMAILCLLTACDARDEASTFAANPDGPPAGSMVGSAANPPTGETEERAPTGADGYVEFAVDGEAIRFDYIAAEHTFYNRMASKIQAQPAPDSMQTATIIFSSVDLRDLEYPIELPLPREARDPGKPMMAMIMTGFGYIDENGNEWAGPGRVRLDSFLADGTLAGSFTNVSLPHTEKTLPNIVLDDGRFSVRIGSP